MPGQKHSVKKDGPPAELPTHMAGGENTNSTSVYVPYFISKSA